MESQYDRDLWAAAERWQWEQEAEDAEDGAVEEDGLGDDLDDAGDVDDAPGF